MATVLRKILPLSLTNTKRAYRDSDDDDDVEKSNSFQIDYSFASEYKGPLVTNVPRAPPVEVDQIPIALPLSLSSSLSSNISYPVVQPLELRTKNKNALVGSVASSSVAFKEHHVAEEAVSLPLSPSPSSSSGEGREEEDVLDDSRVSDVGSGYESPVHGNRVRFDVPSQGSEYGESSYMSDAESLVAATPRAERKGKKGSCYRCLTGNRFIEKEVCIVCRAKYCINCVRRAMGAMPEGRKCQACIGSRIDESQRGSLGKCSRMLKRVLTGEELQQVMQAEVSCKANQLPSRLIAVNGKPLDEEELFKLQTCRNPPKKLKPGNYWYDKVSGFWGKVGEKPCQIISPRVNVGGGNISEKASNGDTGIFINGREITKLELKMLKMVKVQCEGKPHFWLDADGTYREEGQAREIGNIWSKKRAKIACRLFSLPAPPTLSTVEPNDIPSCEQKMLNKILLIGNEKCGATTIYKQARSLYEVPFSEDDRERIKFIIQTNLYTYLATVLEAHKRFDEETSNNNNQSPDQSDITESETVSSISPRLKHFVDWLLKEKEDGNMDIFPASSRENAQTVADLWRVPAVQATYKRLRDSLPRTAVYFLGRILEISRAEYNPSDMDILQAEGLSSMEGLSCVEFTFPSTSQENSLESDYQHIPNTKYQLIRLNPRSLGENWKWMEMFEDADLVIFCVPLTDYGEYIEGGNDGVLTNKMIANKHLFESMVTHPSLINKRFLLVLTKFDLLEDKIEEVPLSICEWFEDFNPLISQNQTSRHNPPMAQRAFHYIGYQFKRLYESLVVGGGGSSLRTRSFKPKLFVSQVSLEGETVDNALRYGREILKWHVEETSTFQEVSTNSIEASTSS